MAVPPINPCFQTTSHLESLRVRHFPAGYGSTYTGKATPEWENHNSIGKWEHTMIYLPWFTRVFHYRIWEVETVIFLLIQVAHDGYFWGMALIREVIQRRFPIWPLITSRTSMALRHLRTKKGLRDEKRRTHGSLLGWKCVKPCFQLLICMHTCIYIYIHILVYTWYKSHFLVCKVW